MRGSLVTENDPQALYLQCSAEPLGGNPGLSELKWGELLAVVSRRGAGEDAGARRHGVNPELGNIQPISDSP